MEEFEENKIENNLVKIPSRNNYCFMRRFLKDIGVIFILCYLFFALGLLMTHGYDPYSNKNFILPLMITIPYCLVCYLLFAVFIRGFKSPVGLFISSIFVSLVQLKLNILSAKSMNYTSGAYGHHIYLKGDITTFGILYKLHDPILYLSAFAVYFIINNKLKNRLKNGR